MKRFKNVTCLLIFICLFGCKKNDNPITKNSNEMEKEQIAQLLEEKYLNGVANKMDTEKMLELFHPDFAIFSSDDHQLIKFPLMAWKNAVDEYKADDKGKPGLRNLTHKLDYIDVTGNAAITKVLLYRNGEALATDYISLLKIEGEWRVVSKVAYSHIENPFEIVVAEKWYLTAYKSLWILG